MIVGQGGFKCHAAGISTMPALPGVFREYV